MVEISTEQSMLITVITFLGLFALFVTTMPHGFIYANPEYRQLNVPSYFEGIDIQSFANTYIINLTNPSDLEQYEFTFGGWNMKLEDWDPPYCYIWIRTQASWWIFRWDFDYFRWYDKDGIERSEFGRMQTVAGERYITYEALDDAYLKYGAKEGLKWNLKNDHTAMVVFVGFNTTKYNKPSDALNGGELSLLLCINFDKMNTSFNAWNLVGSLLFFQTPDVHPVINAIIAIPIWVAIAYLIYILILKAIPFVGG